MKFVTDGCKGICPRSCSPSKRQSEVRYGHDLDTRVDSATIRIMKSVRRCPFDELAPRVRAHIFDHGGVATPAYLIHDRIASLIAREYIQVHSGVYEYLP